jgi:gliding motility-associated lipoprotein GldJ
MIKKFNLFYGIAFFAALLVVASCGSRGKKSASSTTGWKYNDPKNGGFEVRPFLEQQRGPGLVLIEGGTFTMGQTNDNPAAEKDNTPRRVTIPSFYMDQTEVRNIDYVEYLYWLQRVFGANYPQVYRKALPDTLVWREKLAYNEPMVEEYLRHAAYRNYPVVGVSWTQANEYCLWRTDRVNEDILIKKQILKPDTKQQDENNFNTEAYLAGQYIGNVNKSMPSLNPNNSSNNVKRQVQIEDGILLPKYRLPTEAEWEYAAVGLIGNTKKEQVNQRRIYPWNGSQLRSDSKRSYGQLNANFKRGRGDYMGVAGNLNDGASIPAAVDAYPPNDVGLYNMAGNVAEWVQDVYRPLSHDDVSDLSPFRGNVFQDKVTDPSTGQPALKDSLGRMRTKPVQNNANRLNYRSANQVNYKDGDFASTVQTDWKTKPSVENTTALMYDSTSLVTDKSRVYKGGSWKDPAYFLSPATRRFLDQDQSTDFIGFRCAMVRTGSSDQKGRRRK